MTAMLRAALEYASRGWLVHPIRPNGKVPATEHGLRDATTSESTIREWWREDPARNLSVATGAKSGIVVIDIDSREARDAWWALCEAHGGRIRSLAQRTGRGWHIFLRHPGRKVKNSASKICDGVDVRGDGGYVLVPPSVHPSGSVYTWIDADAEVAECPEWLVDLMVAPAVAAASARRAGGGSAPRAGLTAYGSSALEDECQQVARSAEGTRNQALNRAAFRLGQLVSGGELEDSAVEAGLFDAAIQCGLSPSEATRTIRSGITAGMSVPRSADRPPCAADDEPPPPADDDAPPDSSWRDLLSISMNPKTGEVRIRAVATNALVIVRHHPELRGRLALDVRTQTPEWLAAPPFAPGGGARPARDADATELALWISQTEDVVLAHDAIWRAILAEAERNPVDHLKEWLDRLQWDGRQRMSDWLIEYGGVAATEYTRAISRAWLISAVARVYRPGCQADHMLVLEGPQGVGKTSLLRALAGDGWHTEITLAATKDGVMDLHGPWIVEWAELAGLRRAEIESVKALTSRRVDRIRLPYARVTVDLPRRCVLAATTNEGDWAVDTTGNRRYWPVAVSECDPQGLAGAREQLWAEARWAYLHDEPWWLSRSETERAEQEQERRLPADPWAEQILDLVCTTLKTEVGISDIFDHLGLPASARTTGAARRVGYQMQKIGLKQTRRRIGGSRPRAWVIDRAAGTRYQMDGEVDQMDSDDLVPAKDQTFLSFS